MTITFRRGRFAGSPWGNNRLFGGSDNGGATAAILFSFIATCERRHINPFEYLRDGLDRIASTPVSKLPELLPNRWRAARDAMSSEAQA